MPLFIWHKTHWIARANVGARNDSDLNKPYD